jgi:hypothetical protein
MKALKYLLAGGVGIAAIASAAPAAAQYYPGYGYQQPYAQPYGYGGQNVVNQVLGQVLGYGRYPYGNYGYQQYGRGNQSMAINQCAAAVEQRLGGYNGYYGYNNVPYGGRYGMAGGGRVQGVTRVAQKSYGLKVYGVASSGYNGYQGYGNRAYGSYGYGAGADLSWNCEVRYDGRIRDIDINRRTANWRGY